jgi:hypothetical protein
LLQIKTITGQRHTFKVLEKKGRLSMKFKAVIAMVILSCICTFSNVSASEDSHREAAEELLRVSKADEMFKGIWKHLRRSVEQDFQRFSAPEKIAPTIKQYKEKSFMLIEKKFSFDSMKEDLATIYMETYTEDEIRAISGFYKSEAGQKFLEKMPQLTQRSFAMTQKKQRELAVELGQLTKELDEEIKRIENQ